MENSLRVREALSLSKLERVPGEVKVLECYWSFPESLLYDCHRMYAGVAEEIEEEEESERLMHRHRVQDMDGEKYWSEILAYLHMGQLLDSQFEVEKIKRRAKQFFILNGVLW